MLKEMLAKNTKSQIQAEIESHTNDFNQVVANQKKKDDVQKRLDALQQLAAARFLQGNLLNSLQQISAPGVQLTRMRVDQVYLLKPGSPGQTNQFGVIAGRPPVNTEKIVVSLDAKDSSSNPGDAINQFKSTLGKQDYFQKMLDKTNGVRLATLSAPQVGTDGRAYVMFTLECNYPEQSR